jgi:hypothetical protein
VWASARTPVDPPAGGDVLGVVLEQRVREAEHLEHPLVGDPVVDGAVLATAVDEAAPAQAGEVARNLRLRGADPLDQLADRALALGERLKYPQPGGVAEAAEVLGDDVDLDRLLGELERRFSDGCHVGFSLGSGGAAGQL